MPGEGFLKQAIESFRYNRSLQRKEQHKPFEKKEARINEKKGPVRDDKKLSTALRYNIKIESDEFNQTEIKKRIIAAVIAIALLLLGLYFVGNMTF
jgi:hypothetical protein